MRRKTAKEKNPGRVRPMKDRPEPMKDRPEPVSPLILEQLALGELPENRARELMGDPEVRRRVEELKASSREILEAYPPAEEAAAIRARAEEKRAAQGPADDRAADERAADERAADDRPADERPADSAGTGVSDRRRFGKRALVFLPAAAAAAVMVLGAGIFLAVQGGMGGPDGAAGSDGAAGTAQEIRIKGASPDLRIYRKSEGGAESLTEGAEVQAGDRLQVAYRTGAGRHGLILSRDGRGAVTVHLAGDGRRSASLDPGGEGVLPFSYVLDDAPRYEDFYLITAPKPFPGEPQIRSLRETGELNSRELPDGYAVRIVHLQKEASGE